MRYAPTMNLGAPELLILLVIILLVFGGTKLPKLARSLGQAQKEFKQGLTEGQKLGWPVGLGRRERRGERAWVVPGYYSGK